MEPRISLVTLAVADMDRARAFYGALGWKPTLAMQDVTFYQAGGMAFGLWHRKPFTEETGLPATSGGLCLAHNVRDRAAVDALLRDAGTAGAKVKPAKAQDWGGYSGFFRDPDGHLWEVAWNPAWTLDADGNVHLG